MGRGKSAKNLELIQAARTILEEIQPATVRAVCYRLFVLGMIDSMDKASTNRVSAQLTWARERGVIPWLWVVDETRGAERVAGWENPDAFMRTVERAYRRDRWTLQPVLVEVWSEKGTVRGTLRPILDAYGVTFRVMHGYASATTIYEVVEESRADGRDLIALYIGDWDPSGLHMSEVDLPARLAEYGAASISVRRVALRDKDVRDRRLPWFDARTKLADSRCRWYRERYGQRCFELDAMNPVRLRDRVAESIRAYIDADAWNRCARAEAAEQESLATVLHGWRVLLPGRP